MNEYLKFGLLCFTSFFALINPLGSIPIYMSLTHGFDENQKIKTYKKSVIIAFFILIVFSLSGQYLFKIFGISNNSFRVVGGIIFFIVGMDMLQAKLGKTKVEGNKAPLPDPEHINDIAITPLAIPVIAGPGTIANAILLMGEAQTIGMKTVLIISILLILILTFIFMWSSAKITKILGDTGVKVIVRIMGLIMMVIAIEFFFSGIFSIIDNHYF